MALDDLERGFVLSCLKRERILLEPEKFSKFCAAIEASMTAYREEVVNSRFRADHDALRKLWQLSHSDKDRLQIGVIRRRVANLPNGAAQYVNDRAPNVLRRLFPEQFPLDADIPPNFQSWARDAGPENLVRAVAVITAEGAKNVVGRSRGRGTRSESKSEPVIFGIVRDDKEREDDPAGGRPAKSAERQLVTHLALDWVIATEITLEHGRPGSRGFNELVECVFQWLKRSRCAKYALRTFWETKILPI